MQEKESWSDHVKIATFFQKYKQKAACLCLCIETSDFTHVQKVNCLYINARSDIYLCFLKLVQQGGLIVMYVVEV
jgi:hypothetical protein